MTLCPCGLRMLSQPNGGPQHCPVHGHLTAEQLRFKLGLPPARRRTNGAQVRPEPVLALAPHGPTLVAVELFCEEDGQWGMVEA